MTHLFDTAIQSAKSLPDHLQDEAGKMLLELVEQEGSGLFLSDAQKQEVNRRIAADEALVPVDEMNVFFRKLVG